MRLTALAWLGMHNHVYLWLNPKGRLTAHEVAKLFGGIFVRGIANPDSPPAAPGDHGAA